MKPNNKRKFSFIETTAEKLGLIKKLRNNGNTAEIPRLTEPDKLTNYPPPEKWNDWEEYESKKWPDKVKKKYFIVPTTCFNCEAACGLLTYVDKETLEVRKFEGNPYHPASRGRNCAKGPATINQLKDVDRILYPLKRAGKRGEGKWERVSWDSVLDDIAGRIRKAMNENRHNEIVYHVGRPGHEGYMERVLQSWGIDGHNSHTNICSAGARFGYAIWQGYDRPSPDYANADFILLISSHLETGHYFNPHAQRIIEAKMRGAKIAVMDPRLSNTASMADYWMPTYPGTEPAVLLSMAKVMLDEGLYNREFIHDWVNWQDYKPTFEDFINELKSEYSKFTPEFAEKESGVPAETIVNTARLIGRAGSRFSCHTWRSAASGNLGGWQVSRCIHFLSVLTGSVGTYGGTLPSSWNKFKPKFFDIPPAQKFWNELSWPIEYPLTHYEMSHLLPHFLKEGRGRLDVYFTRVFNPVWTYPDGFTWIESLTDESKVGIHIALTPTWNETVYYADYVLPMGHASERHDINSYETHAGVWIAFRQPVMREVAKRMGKNVKFTYEVNPGEVWEEDEFWIELSWRIDPDGSLGIKRHFESPYRKGEKITIDEYYQYIFENVPGLKEISKKENLTPLEYMRKYGTFEVEKNVYEKHKRALTQKELEGTSVDPKTNIVIKDGKAIGVVINGKAVEGFPTPSRRQEFFSKTMVEWGWSEYTLPGYIKSHIHSDEMDRDKGDFCLVPTFRLPTLIHTRSGNAKWLVEIAHRNPVWIHTTDAKRLGLKNGDLVRVNTDIGYFIDKVWVTEGMRPGVIACSHHIGRWRRPQDTANNRWATNLVNIEQVKEGKWRMRLIQQITPFKSGDNDTERIFWQDGGVHQNITFPVHPDPISGMHCWHQKVRVEKPRLEDKYGDVFVDTNRSFHIYKEWVNMTRPPKGDLRRPMWMNRPLRPVPEAYRIQKSEVRSQKSE